MPNRTTYYTKEELDRLEQLAEEKEESFSGLVRKAIQEEYDL